MSGYANIHYLPQTHPISKADTPEHFPNGITSFALEYKSQKLNFSFLTTQLRLDYTDVTAMDHEN